MGKLTSREYISRQGIGSSIECERLKQTLGQTLRAWHSERRIVGFHVLSLCSEAEIVDEDLVDSEIPRLTDNRLPVVWVNVTFQPPQFSEPARGELEATHDLLLICETESLD